MSNTSVKGACARLRVNLEAKANAVTNESVA